MVSVFIKVTKVLLFFYSCIFPEVVAAQRAEWTIMYYVMGDSGDKSAEGDVDARSIKLFKSLSQQEIPAGINVVMQIDRCGRNYRTTEGLNWGGTRRFIMQAGLTHRLENAVPGFGGEVNMGNPRELRDFITWSMQEKPASKYMLVILSHGTGFSLYGSEPDFFISIEGLFPRYLTFNDINSYNTAIDSLSSSDFRHVDFSSPCTGGDSELSADEITEALENLPNNSSIDLLFLESCYFISLETSYQLRTSAKYLLGSEGFFPLVAMGRPFQLASLKGKEAEDVAEKLVNKFQDRLDADALNWYLISGIKQEFVKEFFEGINDIARKLRLALNSVEGLKAIRNARNVCNTYDSLDLENSDLIGTIDLYLFLTKLSKERVLSSDLRKAINEVLKNWQRIVIANKGGKFRKKRDPQGRIYGFGGLAIFFPRTSVTYLKSRKYHGYNATTFEFVNKGSWKSFLDAYFLRIR